MAKVQSHRIGSAWRPNPNDDKKYALSITLERQVGPKKNEPIIGSDGKPLKAFLYKVDEEFRSSDKAPEYRLVVFDPNVEIVVNKPERSRRRSVEPSDEDVPF